MVEIKQALRVSQRNRESTPEGPLSTAAVLAPPLKESVVAADLVQILSIYLIRPDAVHQRNTRSLWRKAPAAEYDFLDEKAGQPENIEIRWPDRF